MIRRLFTAVLGLLALVSSARAQILMPSEPQATEAMPSLGPPAIPAWPVDGPSGDGRAWAEADFLLWWMKGAALPPLVTTSPAGTPINQAGVLGNPSTTVLFGNSTVNEGLRAGGRVKAGYWFDDARSFGIEADFFLLETKAAGFAATSGGSPVLARPFTDANGGAQASERIAFPGDLAGAVRASDGTTGLLGAGVLLRENVCCADGFRLDSLLGYRYLRFADRLAVNEDLTSVSPNNPNFIPVGTTLVVSDRFATSNDLHAVDLGLTGEWRRGPLTLALRGKLAVGYNHQVVDINGGTTVTVPGLPPSISGGGLLALGGNIGRHSRDEVSVVPELDLKLAYRVTPRLTASVGYSFLYWDNVVRAADQIDGAVNATLIPPAVAPVGPIRPDFAFQRTGLWAQGINFGLQLCY